MDKKTADCDVAREADVSMATVSRVVNGNQRQTGDSEKSLRCN